MNNLKVNLRTKETSLFGVRFTFDVEVDENNRVDFIGETENLYYQKMYAPIFLGQPQL